MSRLHLPNRTAFAGIRKAALGAIAIATVAGLAFGVAPAASANPTPGTNPVVDLFGSDTTQDVSNGFASVIRNSSGQPLIASYDATSAGTSVTPGEISPLVTVPVANGSGQGKTLLTAAINGTSVSLANGGTLTSFGPLSRDDVEVARSSNTGSWNTIGVYAYVPFAVDAVTYATASSTSVPNGIPLGSTVGQDSDGDGIRDLTLKNIYGYLPSSASVTLENTANTTFVVGKQGTGASIVPFKLAPDSGYATSSSIWESAIGGIYASRVAEVYTDATGAHVVHENDGSVLAAVPNALVPFSIAQHISQSKASILSSNYGITVVDRRHGAVLRNIGSVAPLDIDGNQNASFPVNRVVFNIVENAAITSGTTLYNSNLVDLFIGSSAKVLTAKRPGSSTVSVINDFGFRTIPSGGITPLDGKTYTAGTPYRSN